MIWLTMTMICHDNNFTMICHDSNFTMIDLKLPTHKLNNKHEESNII